MDFIRFWVNLDIFTMVKLIKPPMNWDKLLQMWIGPLILNETMLLSSDIQIYQAISLNS